MRPPLFLGEIGMKIYLCTFLVVATASLSAPTDEPHLSIIERTTEETERVRGITAPTTDFSQAQKFEASSVGVATVRASSGRDVFSQHSKNLSFDQELDFKMGNGLFRKIWVSSPSSTLASDGLGPLYNARSCQRCHIKDGRGHPPENSEDNSVSMFLRISIPGEDSDGFEEIEGYLATLPDPNYGTQLQDYSVGGHPAEYRLEIDYEEYEVALSDGEFASLRTPTYSAADLGYGPLHPEAMLSPRIAPQMIGLGMLEAIPAADILANEDPEDADSDGISGRANVVWSTEFERPMLGRFGLKAGAPTVRSQSAGAFAGDIGISSPLVPGGWGECTEAQSHCRSAPNGEDETRGSEIDQESLDLVTFYSQNLAVPARRDVGDPEVLRGKEVFHTSGCTGCHQPNFVTHRLKGDPAKSFQLIWPYTDMLLHDMGPELADNRPEARANGQEWRTPPLWGIGLTKQVSEHEFFLHDGRARGLLEAILWHGGEGHTAREKVVEMPAQDRAALIRFLESL